MTEKKDVLQVVDDEARRLGKGLVRCARFGALAHQDAKTGEPHVSRVGVATTQTGAPSILISELSPHFAGLTSHATCSILLGEPGKGDPLAHPRITVMAKARRVADEDERALIRSRYLLRHPKAELYVDFADFAFWVLEPTGAALNGGYGKAYALEAEDILSPIAHGLDGSEPGAVAHMNEDHLDAIELYASTVMANAGAGWKLASLDTEGMDIMRAEQLARVWYPEPLQASDKLRMTLATMAKQIRAEAG